MKRPWMPLYIADYLKKTTHLGALESGAYLHLIMDYWQNDGLPEDERQLARIARLTDKEWKKLKPTLQAFFCNGWKHERIDEEIKRAEIISKQRRKAVAERERRRHQNSIERGSFDPSNDAGPMPHSTQYTVEEPIQGKTLSGIRMGGADDF